MGGETSHTGPETSAEGIRAASDPSLCGQPHPRSVSILF